ncbi:unnamed protein product [Lupinus luteus]|uniref:Cytochrome P450 n=1 Tax=Lupinus luteus TaxID=3873 RepID=A0AAV1XYK5_LUPLU
MPELLLQLFTPFFFFIFFLLPLFFFFFFLALQKNHKKVETHSSTTATAIPKAYPLIGSYFAFKANNNRRIQWLSDAVLASPNVTFTFHQLLGEKSIITANPATVQHILKTQFSNYQKGGNTLTTLSDFLGAGIFNVNGENWKFQRQVASHEFNSRSLRKFVEVVVEAELNQRLIPTLNDSQSQSKTLDFQDILQRFAFDNICKIAFGFDPEYLTPSLKDSNLTKAFEDAHIISTKRFREPLALVWKMKRKLNIGSEKRLRIAVSEVQEFARKIVREKKKELKEKASLDSVDMLSRFLTSGHSDEDFLMDIVISFILAGKYTTSAALTWFFWILSKNPRVEKEIMKEIREKSEGVRVYEEVKDMVYTHAALSESMRLYPPVPMDDKDAMKNDVLPDGTIVKKGMSVAYHVYAMIGLSFDLKGG